MSDLDHIDATTQPLTIPVLGSQDGEYDAPSTDWDGTPVRAALSSGAEAAGLAPDTDLDAQVLNDLAGRLGAGLASVIDRAILEWDPIATIDGQPNENHWGDPGIGQGGAWSVPYLAGTPYAQDALYQFNAVKVFRSWDGRNWEDLGAHGAPTQPRGLATGLLADGVTTGLVAWNRNANGQIRASLDDGATWQDAGALPASFDSSTTHGGSFNGRFFICGRSQLYYQDDLETNVEWSRIITSGFWTGSPPAFTSCFAASPTECAFGINGEPSLIHSSDGATWAAAPLPTDPADGISALVWSTSHRLWIATTVTGRVLTAPAGFGAWTQRTFAPTAGSKAVCAHGRTVILGGFQGLWISRDLANWRRVPDVRLTDDGVNTDTWEHLLSFNGRIWCARRRQVSGNAGIEYTMSGVLPAEFRKIGAW